MLQGLMFIIHESLTHETRKLSSFNISSTELCCFYRKYGSVLYTGITWCGKRVWFFHFFSSWTCAMCRNYIMWKTCFIPFIFLLYVLQMTAQYKDICSYGYFVIKVYEKDAI